MKGVVTDVEPEVPEATVVYPLVVPARIASHSPEMFVPAVKVQVSL
jgi:hypothetical protein